jgi:hypothetical protein
MAGECPVVMISLQNLIPGIAPPRITALVAIIMLSFLCGCSNHNPHLYHWGAYPSATYAYLRGDKTTAEEQLDALLQTLSQARERERRVPPGLHAQIGLVYARMGNSQLARKHWEQEKALFPASTEFINFIMEKHEP